MNFVKSEPGADPIVVEAQFSASPSQVFRAWTEPDRVKKWFGVTPGALSAVAIDLRPGGSWRFTEEADDHGSIGFEGQYIEVEQDRRLVFSWSKFNERQGCQPKAKDLSRVEISLEVDGDGTRMRITHSALHDRGERIGFRIGWDHGITNLERELAAAIAP